MIKIHLEKRSGEKKIGHQDTSKELEEYRGDSTEQSWMEKSDLWPMFCWQ